jgi:hypothetical protein
VGHSEVVREHDSHEQQVAACEGGDDVADQAQPGAAVPGSTLRPGNAARWTWQLAEQTFVQLLSLDLLI